MADDEEQRRKFEEARDRDFPEAPEGMPAFIPLKEAEAKEALTKHTKGGRDWNDFHREHGTEGARESFDEAMAEAEAQQRASRREFDDVEDEDEPASQDPPPPSLDAIVERALKENPDGPFNEDLLEKFERLKREQTLPFARLCKRYPALATAVRLDATMVRALLEQASKDEVVKLFIDLAVVADLNAVETDGLLRLAAKKAGVTLRPLTSDLKQAQAEQAAQRAREARAKRRAARTDPRPQVPVPPYSDPFLPVMATLNAVVDALVVSERPPRDIDGVSTRLRKLSVPTMHAFDQTQANAGDDDDD